MRFRMVIGTLSVLASLILTTATAHQAHAAVDTNIGSSTSIATLSGTLRWHNLDSFTIPTATLKDGNCGDDKGVYWFIRWNTGWTSEGRGPDRPVAECSYSTWTNAIGLSKSWINHIEIWVCRDDPWYQPDECTYVTYRNPYAPN